VTAAYSGHASTAPSNASRVAITARARGVVDAASDAVVAYGLTVSVVVWLSLPPAPSAAVTVTWYVPAAA